MTDIIIFAKALSKSMRSYVYNSDVRLLASCIDEAIEIIEAENLTAAQVADSINNQLSKE
jgi:hypothetical protein